MSNVYIAFAKRSAIGSLLGSLSHYSAPKLGAELIKHLLTETKIDPMCLDEVIMGQVLTGGVGQNPARQSAVFGGVPHQVPAFTINKVCGSGMQSIILAFNAILSGNAHLVIAGGQESMSQSMHALYMRKAVKFGGQEVLDMMYKDGLSDAFSGEAMGVTAENIASRFNISRQEQDEFAFSSQRKAANAIKEGWFTQEILPLACPKEQIFLHDEQVRADTSLEGLTKLKTVFKKDGTVTAGNSSTINDGVAVTLICSEHALKEHNLTPIAKIVGYSMSGVDPNIMGTGPAVAAKRLLDKVQWNVNDVLVESNEAFAAQAIYVNRELAWNTDAVNVCGGAIALGHPIGASGCRIVVTLIHQLKRLKMQKGVATLCIGGGMGLAMAIAGV
ncbi:Acetyl-CoA acetyltransferase [Rickettsiales endosymbiont of Paramecium tredecaurelia]|uniref:acetyl-CoA C-acetyltransferase n=1 Tax=Candidatus Sarmatiella mevalonica TaxID=2770581 RepID=UPI0019207370|nr:acetyl-CoA C-acetyltransferase [Candidatus Sarmatiella mevalonica]MBL3285065.1 Acetyl-CoA acetyltransferase [Candidatus Sarmatiella mevalonica]